MADSDFWCDLAAKFRALAAGSSNRELRAMWSGDLDDSGLEAKREWRLIATGPGWLGSVKTIQVEFEALARRGGLKIDPSLDSLDAWLDALNREGPEDVTHGEGTHQNADGEVVHHRFGTINQVCAASADYCKILEARALEVERRMSGWIAKGKQEIPPSWPGDWDSGRTSQPSRNKRGRPALIPADRKLKALSVQGGKARAQILYNTKYPTPQQIKNVRSILRHFEQTHQPL
jgi:hypothetical protein